ncbi:MAG TPA: membrane protein insertase YidC [Methylocystis sp.]|nr:membrane protein insertase YidC [Methylocystis sp.]
MTPHTKNMITAALLSLAFIALWDYFFAFPNMEKQRLRYEQQKHEAQLPKLGAPEKPVAPATAASTAKPRPVVLAESPRVEIDTRSIKGSIALKGARIDDVSLRNYRETVDKSSPIITLLSPEGGPQAYWADWGYLSSETENAPTLPTTETLWTADHEKLTASEPLTLTWDNGQGLKFVRKISVDDDYLFSIEDSVENTTERAVTLYPHTRLTRVGHPVRSGYVSIFEGFIGVVGEADGIKEHAENYDKVENERKTFRGSGGWVGFTDKYWAATLAPDQNEAIEASYTASGGPIKTYEAETVTTPKIVEAGGTLTTGLRLFAGAKEVDVLDGYMAKQGLRGFDLLIDWGRLYFITRWMFRLLDTLHKFVGNFGLAVLAVTVIVRGAFFPIANASYKSMAKIRAVQPKLKELKEKYGDDKHKLNMEQMELYKREKINPLGGCWPLLLQMPVFIALYNVLAVAIEMRHAPFYGWIKDLSAPDPLSIFNLFGLLPFDPSHIAVFGPYLALGLWPALNGFIMWLQMKMNPEPTDEIQKTMFGWMPIIFTFFMATAPSGLVIYWTWSGLLSIAQQWYIMTRHGVKFELWDNLKKTFSRT